MPRVPVIYSEKNTILHRRDPRAKILVFVLLVAYLYTAPTWEWMLALTLVGLVMALVAQVARGWLLILWLLQIPNVLALIIIPAYDQLVSGNFALEGGLAFGLKLAFAWSAALFVSVSLLSTMDVDELADGLRGLGLPEVLSFTVEYTFMLIYLCVNDLFRITDAMNVKGVELEARHFIRFIGNLPRLMVPAIITIVRRATTMMSVLQMRGFSTSKRKQQLSLGRFDFADLALLAISGLIYGLALSARLGSLPAVA